jgi:hypothetical protein
MAVVSVILAFGSVANRSAPDGISDECQAHLFELRAANRTTTHPIVNNALLPHVQDAETTASEDE